jgi:nicotinate-nucleotide pyrophosphorylase (carboxylating)
VIGGAALVEVSGGVTLATVRDYALPGVDVISVGALTHSALAADLSLSVAAARR